jgi:hypothetical protein
MEIESIEIRPLLQSSSRTKIKSVTITLSTDYPQVWQQLLAGTSTSKTSVSVNQTQSKIIITSTATKQINFPGTEITTEALYAGKITCSTTSVPVTYGNIDITQNYPCILDIAIDEGTNSRLQSTITAIVRNATAPFDIHANLTGLTNNTETFDVAPDYSSPDSITATSWVVPHTNTVRWTNIAHPQYDIGNVIIVSFWICNTENNMQFVTERAFQRKNTVSWY